MFTFFPYFYERILSRRPKFANRSRFVKQLILGILILARPANGQHEHTTECGSRMQKKEMEAVMYNVFITGSKLNYIELISSLFTAGRFRSRPFTRKSLFSDRSRGYAGSLGGWTNGHSSTIAAISSYVFTPCI